MKHLNFSSKRKLIYKNISPFLICTVTFQGSAQRLKPGPAFAKASPDSNIGKGSVMVHTKEMLTSERTVPWLTRLVTCLSPCRIAINPRRSHLGFVVKNGTVTSFLRALQLTTVSMIPSMLNTL